MTHGGQQNEAEEAKVGAGASPKPLHPSPPPTTVPHGSFDTGRPQSRGPSDVGSAIRRSSSTSLGNPAQTIPQAKSTRLPLGEYVGPRDSTLRIGLAANWEQRLLQGMCGVLKVAYCPR